MQPFQHVLFTALAVLASFQLTVSLPLSARTANDLSSSAGFPVAAAAPGIAVTPVVEKRAENEQVSEMRKELTQSMEDNWGRLASQNPRYLSQAQKWEFENYIRNLNGEDTLTAMKAARLQQETAKAQKELAAWKEKAAQAQKGSAALEDSAEQAGSRAAAAEVPK